MQFDIVNVIYFAGRLAPSMLVFFFVLISIFNQDWRGVFYLSGVVFACVFAILVSNTIDQLFDKSPVGINCSVTGNLISNFPLSSVVLGFTIMYIFVPMMQIYGRIQNGILFVCMLLFVVIDVIFILRNKCTQFFGLVYPLNVAIPIFMSYCMGGLVAFLYVVIATSTNSEDMLYFGTKNAGPFCKLKNDNKMSCRVFRNGELVTDT